MIRYVTGDIFETDAAALVNTVNTVGVMGKGIALQSKRRFPDNYEAYRRACEAGDVTPGKMFVWRSDQLGNPQWIINFPTKRHWKGKSRLEDIEAGLRDLRRQISALRIESIAVPPLGCGNGGLDWSRVRPLIARALQDLDGVEVEVYEPAGAPRPADMAPNPTPPRMTPHRAAMLAAFARYLEPGFTLGRVEAQKLIYFLDVAGAPFNRLKFEQGPFGPYADGIRHVLNQVEGHFIEGFGDADTASAMRPLPQAVTDARAMLEDSANEAFRRAVVSVADLTAGFDDAFGLELLASVHWVATRANPPARNASEAYALIGNWSDRKRQRYDESQVRAAWRRLEETGFVVTALPEVPLGDKTGTVMQPVPEGDLVASAL